MVFFYENPIRKTFIRKLISNNDFLISGIDIILLWRRAKNAIKSVNTNPAQKSYNYLIFNNINKY